MSVRRATVRAVNELTARWAGAEGGGTVFSAAGLWPLLAFLADGADGPARAELADALGVPADEAGGFARELLETLGVMRGLDAALGVWTTRSLELREAWRAGLPAGAHGVLTGDPEADQGALDAWAAQATRGLVKRMPVALTDDTDLVLATALALRTRWLQPFSERPVEFEGGPWDGRGLLSLWRQTVLLDRVGVADTPHGFVTELKVLGDNALDVHLLLGEPDMTPDQVLGAGVGVLAGRHHVTPGPRLPFGSVGPGLAVVRERSETPDPPTLDVMTVAFDLAAEHELLQRSRLFGLTTASDTTRGHFPGISRTRPLAVESARQAAMARFGSHGFEAAAVTVIGAAGAGIPQLRWLTTRVRLRFDRPFGFLAVQRHTRLALAAGWVTDPTPYRDEEP
ncbi:proteinase inhibitor I4 serpin [Streptomyces sp. Ru71]|uniref:serpin family protein n=1 Tax=Streptomyces sp. Ru71 TaxID=2080746 RepID=UPI000CDD4CB0|nr:serpin family protein [Streptomyces sp. Ru71]POX55850.1 proteinase inhibitor I4 serpin [Streptomyces sp. Ru71]